MKYLLFMAAMLTVTIFTECGKMQHLGHASVSPVSHQRTAERQLVNTASINGIVAGIFLLSMVGTVAMRLWRRNRLQATKIHQLQHALTENTREKGLKTQLFNTISQEFRTPLTLILAPVENELKNRSSAEGKESLLLIKRNASHLLGLVNQVLDFSKIQSGKVELHVRQGNIVQVTSATITSFDSIAQASKTNYVKEITVTDGPHWFDHDKLEKIVANLLAAAFRNNRIEGSVKIALSMIDQDTLGIVVTDTILQKSKEEPINYSTLQNTAADASSEEGGNSIGLCLVRDLTRIHKGTFKAEEFPGASVFTVTIPVSRSSFSGGEILDSGLSDVKVSAGLWPGGEPMVSDWSAETAHNSKDSILIVEDNTDMREYIATILQEQNYTVFRACNGEEAINLTLNYVPSLVLSDLMMPKMDGLEMTRYIKQDERTSHIPVILLTAKNEVESKLKGLKIGADDYLTKPFLPEELLVRIDNLIAQRKMLQGKFRERILVNPTPNTEMSLDSRFLNKARTIVESNLSDCAFTVEKMADEMNLSRTQLLRKLKALTGLSPNDFIKDIRLKRAADMIKRKTDTITQIGFAVGFNDQSYFTKCFKKQFGMTPSDFSANAASHGEGV